MSNYYVIPMIIGFIATIVSTAIGVFIGMVAYEKYKKG